MIYGGAVFSIFGPIIFSRFKVHIDALAYQSFFLDRVGFFQHGHFVLLKEEEQ